MRLLVIDDQQDICDLIADVARLVGYDVSTISDSEQASDALNESTPDVVLLDLMMPGTDGIELLRLLADKARSARICLMSGSDIRVLNSARRLGGAHGLNIVNAIAKPFEVSELRLFLEEQKNAQSNDAPTNLAKAIAEKQFILYYQPVVDIASGAVKSAEALVRWQHPRLGILSPDKFLEKIMSEGLIAALTTHVATEAISQAAKWYKEGKNLKVAINIMASSLLELTLPDRLATLCVEYSLPTEQLIVEITETEAMKDVSNTMDVLLRMRLRDIGIAMDDFGTGHSSLRELQRMPFSELKIDRSFVSDMATSRDSAIIVKSMIDLGHNLGLNVVAEGVEDITTWNLLRDRGCDLAQGYFIARPMPATDLEQWLKSWKIPD